MKRSGIFAAIIVPTLVSGFALASSADQADTRGVRDWRGGKLCANCQADGDAAASRIGGQVRIATKLVAANTCADPGQGIWFAEEEDHLAAFINSTTTQYK
ncbi:MAG: hypothetical protein ABJB04_06360 [Betaproteobacteria bacterium]